MAKPAVETVAVRSNPACSNPARPALIRILMTAVLPAVFVLMSAGTMSAQVLPLFSEFTVSQSTTVCSQIPDVATTSDGRFVAVWRDSTSQNFFGQRYASTGMPLGNIMTLHTGTGLTSPRLGAADDGGFVVVWDEVPDFITGSIVAKRFDSAGTQLGSTLAISNTTERNIDPSVSTASDGRFVVAWQKAGDFEQGNPGTIVAKRFASDGSALGATFEVAPSTNSPYWPDVGVEPDGDSFTVVWHDSSDTRIRARRFDSSGSEVGSAFTVNTYTSGSQRQPSVDMDASGGFVVTWTGASAAGSDSAMSAIFDSSGTNLSMGELNNAVANTAESFVHGVIGNEGALTASAWTHVTLPDQMGPGTESVRGAFPVEGDIEIPTFTSGTQKNAVIAMDDRERAVVLWERDENADNCGDIAAQRLQLLLPLSTAMPTTTAVHSVTQGAAWRHFIYMPQGAGTVTIQMALDGGLDADLYVRDDAIPETGLFDCRPFLGGGSTETCTLDVTGDTNLAVAVNGFAVGRIGFTLTVTEVPALFTDGFESGNTSKWSATVP